LTAAVVFVRLLGLALLLWSSSLWAADLVVIVNPACTSVLTKEQIADAFLGKSELFTPIDQAEASLARAEFYRKATGRDLAQVKSAWSRIVFTGRGQPPREVIDAAAVKKAVAADAKAIGYIDRASLDDSVRVVLTLN
jgi:ABC-type phosphate transport system substrate-binding protein